MNKILIKICSHPIISWVFCDPPISDENILWPPAFSCPPPPPPPHLEENDSPGPWRFWWTTYCWIMKKKMKKFCAPLPRFWWPPIRKKMIGSLPESLGVRGQPPPPPKKRGVVVKEMTWQPWPVKKQNGRAHGWTNTRSCEWISGIWEISWGSCCY